jgi:hypothetical protein
LRKVIYIQEKITRTIDSIEDLQIILNQMPAKNPPDTRNLKFHSRRAEFVELDNVVGCLSLENGWNISTSPGRGIENIFKFVKGFQNNSIDLNGHDNPIMLIEHNGDFFLEQDDRHRIAALKALGVKKIPALVARAFHSE